MANTDLKGTLIGLGNPLLDISTSVNKEFLDKYELKPASACLANPDKHMPLYDELTKNYKVEYTAGGGCQNVIRAAQWMLPNHPGTTTYFGCIGTDENGANMKKAIQSSGVNANYLVDENTKTGTCAVLVTDKERSLVAYLGAAEKYVKEKHFDLPEVQEIAKKAQYFYTEGFFLTVSPETMIAMGKLAKETNKYFMLNLSAPFLISFFWDKMNAVLPYTDVVFCNEDEATAFGAKQNWGTDLVEIAQKLVAWPKENTQRSRVVVFTQGPNQTLIVSQEGRDFKVERYEPIKVSAEELVDTNGAGDSFVGGFLSQFIQRKSFEECAKAGHYCAWECIRRSGATYPETCNFKN